MFIVLVSAMTPHNFNNLSKIFVLFMITKALGVHENFMMSFSLFEYRDFDSILINLVTVWIYQPTTN